jgi:tetratricopeptide (TPR) repeat protein
MMKSHRCPNTIVPSIAIFLALQFALFGQTTNDRTASIVSALSSREFDKVLQLLQPALQSAPNNPQLWMFQGLAYSGKGDQKSALSSYKKSLKFSPDYLPALEGAAQLEYEAGSADAVPLLEHVLRLRPHDTTSHAMLAVLAYKSGDCSTAAQHFSESEQILDSQPGALQEYGVCLLKMKQTDKALRIFQELLAAHPDDASARRGLATIQLDAGQPQDALSTLQPLLDSNPDVGTMQLAAAVYEANKDTPNAVRILREAIVSNPLETSLYVDFANIAMNHQSFQTGIEMINVGLKLQPGAAELYLARGVLYVQLADYDKAEADFERAEQFDSHQGLSAAAQGMMAEERNQNDPDQALATVRERLAKKPPEAFLWYIQATILSQKAPEPGSPEFQQGITSARKAVALDPSLTAAHNVLSKYYLDSGQYSVAAQECRKVLDENPTDQTALYHLVLALRKTNQQAEIPDLLKRLAKARQDATRQEAERNRFKLVISSPAPN